MSVAWAPRAHGREGLVARGVQEGDDAAGRRHMVGTDVLGDAAGFARRNLGAADVVQQRGLAVVHVAHDGDHGGARLLGSFLLGHFLGREGFGIVQRSDLGGVAHFLDHDHGRVLVQGLVDGDHLAHLHQHLDQLGCLDRHLVRQLGHGDGLGHVHFDGTEFRCRALVLSVIAVIATTAATRAAAPVGTAAHATGAVATGLDFLLLAIAGPARGELGGLDFAGAGRRARRRPAVVPAGLCSVVFLASAAAGAAGFATGLGSSGFLATSTFLGAAIMARMASASASALRRRSSRSLARSASSAARALDSSSALARAASWASARAIWPAACSREASCLARLASTIFAASAAA